MATILPDPEKFDYADGDLNGNGVPNAWSGSTNYDIQGVTYFADGGAKAVKIVGTDDESMTRSGTGTTDGKTTFYFYTNAYPGHESGFRFKEGANFINFFNFGSNSGKVSYLNAGGSAWVDFGDFTANTWHYVESEWRSSDKKWRFRCTKDGDVPGAYTDWVSPFANFTTNVNAVALWTYTLATTYWDYIAEEPYAAAGGTPSWRDVLQAISNKPRIINDKGGVI